MVHRCVVCRNRSDRRPELIFHGFPKDETLRVTWLKNMGITKELSKSSTICSIHFSEECFKPAIVSGKPILQRGSIPTILTEEELMKQETIPNENLSDSLNSRVETQEFDNENVCHDSNNQLKNMGINDGHDIDISQQIEIYAEEIPKPKNVDKFKNTQELQIITENGKMMEELQYSCRKIKVKGVKWDEFCKMPKSLQEMHWMEAQNLIEQQSSLIKSLRQKNRRYMTKIQNLTIYTKSMKAEIAKRARNFKMENL